MAAPAAQQQRTAAAAHVPPYNQQLIMIVGCSCHFQRNYAMDAAAVCRRQ